MKPGAGPSAYARATSLADLWCNFLTAAGTRYGPGGPDHYSTATARTPPPRNASRRAAASGKA